MPEIGVNKVILIGRTGADAELKYPSGGKAVTNFSLAVNERFKNGDGEQRERVQWVRCVAWGKLAEICGEVLTKDQGRRKTLSMNLTTQIFPSDLPTYLPDFTSGIQD